MVSSLISVPLSSTVQAVPIYTEYPEISSSFNVSHAGLYNKTFHLPQALNLSDKAVGIIASSYVSHSKEISGNLTIYATFMMNESSAVSFNESSPETYWRVIYNWIEPNGQRFKSYSKLTYMNYTTLGSNQSKLQGDDWYIVNFFFYVAGTGNASINIDILYTSTSLTYTAIIPERPPIYFEVAFIGLLVVSNIVVTGIILIGFIYIIRRVKKHLS